jgi:glycosyltransferase involved in cell wall biosynthesis
MTPVKVSVCIPTYNGAEFVAAAIQSVLDQSFTDFELIVVDDCSTDETVNIVRSFADPRIQWHQNEERLGIPANWNRCLSFARGEYVCLFHQDDVMLPENLVRKVSVLDADQTVSFVHSRAELLLDASAPIPLSTNWMEDATDDFIVDGVHYFRRLLFAGNLICAPTVLLRRQILLNLGGFNEGLGFTPDYEMWLKMCVKSRVAFLSHSLVRYRWHGKNASHAYRFEQGIEESLRAATHALQYYLEQTGRREESVVLQEALFALAKVRLWAIELEKGKMWLEEQTGNLQRAVGEREHLIQEQKAWITELETGKTWLAEERERWRKIAEERESLLQERERVLQEQHAWIAELETGKGWLAEERERWRALAEERERVIQEQKMWIADLERGKAWLKRQWRYWRTEAERYHENSWVRLGSRLGVVKPFSTSSPEAAPLSPHSDEEKIER